MINWVFVITKSIAYKVKTHRSKRKYKYLLHSIKQKHK